MKVPNFEASYSKELNKLMTMSFTKAVVPLHFQFAARKYFLLKFCSIMFHLNTELLYKIKHS
jgi:hypothetical protein